MFIREIQEDLRTLHARERGRLIVLTGARQTGKSTLARMAFPEHTIVNLDSPLEREVYERLTPAEWIERFPLAIVDEAQKLPPVIDTIKACYDRDATVRYLLLGSSQILLMRKVRETLAGRAALRELFPFSLPELMLDGPGERPTTSRVVRLLATPDPAGLMTELFPPTLSLSPDLARARVCFESFLLWGGMPVLSHEGFTDVDRFEWLQDYQKTYLERDLADLARLDRLEPFVRAQKAAAMRTAQTINFSELARLADVSPPTARQFMRYLELSYQIAWLPAWFRNPEKRLAKQPKLHFLDPGVRRAILNKRGTPDGAEHESAVVAEIIKQSRTHRLPVDLYHLRTVDGREVDLLIEREDGYIALECKLTEHAAPTDFRHLKNLDGLLDRPLLLGMLVSNDPVPRRFEAPAPLWSVPAAALLSGAAGAHG